MSRDKKLDKITKLLGSDLMQELNSLSSSDLKEKIIVAESMLKVAREELEANPNFQRLKDDLKDLSAGLREVNKRQKAIIDYALSVLEGR